MSKNNTNIRNLDLVKTDAADPGSEKVILGTMMNRPNIIPAVSRELSAVEFSDLHHGDVFDHLVAMKAADLPITTITVITRLRDAGDLDRVGGPEAVADLYRKGEAFAEHYVAVVKEKYQMRSIRNVAVKLANDSLGGNGMTAKDVKAAAVAALQELAQVDPDEGMVKIGKAYEDMVNDLEAGVGGPMAGTGIPDLDRMLNGGFRACQLGVVAARPAVGKTQLGLQIADEVSRLQEHPAPVLFQSMEMSKGELATRMSSRIIHPGRRSITASQISNGDLNDDEWDLVAKGHTMVAEAPLYIDDASSVTVARIRENATRIVELHGHIGAIVIDYLQLIKDENPRVDTRTRVLNASHALKALAKDFGCPVIALAQLNRGPENGGVGGGGRLPRVSDLKESGDIEADADIVILLHREDLTDPDSVRIDDVDLIVGKHRGGGLGTAQAVMQSQHSRIRPLADMPRTAPLAEGYTDSINDMRFTKDIH